MHHVHEDEVVARLEWFLEGVDPNLVTRQTGLPPQTITMGMGGGGLHGCTQDAWLVGHFQNIGQVGCDAAIQNSHG